MVFSLFLIFVVPLFLALFITPFVIGFAESVGAMDMPNERKVHKYPIPRLGGIAIYLSFFLSLILLLYFNPGIHLFATMAPRTSLMLVISLTLVLILGIWDDMRQISPGKKFIGQVLAASIVYIAGFRVSAITSPLDLDLLSLGILDYPATILWVVGVTNAFNLIDGLDGLASGVAVIVSITIFVISIMKGDLTSAMLSLVLAGSVLGFLRYNFNRARIFLGDSGSLFIGFSLAILSMVSSTKGSTMFSLIVPLLTLGLPIMDTLLSMTRRFIRSLLPEHPDSKSFMGKMATIFLPDRGHIHHQLINLGLSHKNVVLVLYFVSCLFGIGAFAVTVTNTVTTVPILIAIGIATFIGVRQLKYKEMAMLRNGVLLPIYEWPIMNNTFFLGFLDLAFIAMAYGTAHFLTNGGSSVSVDKIFLSGLAFIAGIKVIIFYIGGLYKGSFRQMGTGDLIKIFKVISAAGVVAWSGFLLFPKLFGNVTMTLIILDFYISISFVMGIRISYQILNYISRREQPGKKKMLVYGADIKGVLMMQEILDDQSLNFNPVGFLDDDPKLEGKKLNGYPVFGGHWKLERLINKMNVSDIIITSDYVKPAILERMADVARRKNVTIRKFKVRLEDFRMQEKKTAQPRMEYSSLDRQ